MRTDDRDLVDRGARDRAASDLATSFCVEAGAGTGKTKLLVDRFLSIVASGAAPCDRIAAITFTEKAAGEMKVRLRRRIAARLREGGLTEAERGNLDAAAADLERAPISTIHSFAAAILREHSIEAGVDPDFTQLDGLEGALLLEECWEDFLARESHRWSRMLARFLSLGGTIANLHEIAWEMFERRGERACERLFDEGGGGCGEDALRASSAHGASPAGGSGAPHAGPGAPGAERPGDERAARVSALRDAFAAAAARLSALARDHCVNAADLGRLDIGRFTAAMDALDVLTGDDLENFLVTAAIPSGTKGNKGNWRPSETCAEQKGVFKELAALRDAERARLSDELREEVARFSEAFLAFVEERKAAEGVLDFDDLLIKTRELCRDPGALDALRERYRFILVDEFQDTDPVQAEIIYLLAGAPGERGPVRPAPGKLFVVGDPKQSIYRFRKADVEIYERVKERIVERGERLSITQNFRSVPGIVDWVNETFAEIMLPSELGKFQPRYEAIHAWRGAGAALPVMLLDLEIDPAEAGSDDVRRREGEAIARLIPRLLDSGMTVPAASGGERALERGDIAVIYPGTTGIDYYEEPLRAEGIPYIVEGGKLYYTREEVRSLAAAIWAIEDPYDPLALVATLRSALFGASDEELFLFTRAEGKLSYLDPGDEARRAFGDLAAALDLLRELHFKRHELGPAGTLLELLRRTKYLELSLLRPHGDQRVSNIRKAVASARGFEGAIHSFRRFARWFRDQEELAAVEGESPIVEDEAQAVRLLTVHKAKGLQFPVVILANLVQTRRGSPRILVERGNRLAFSLGSLETSDYGELREREAAREYAETVRLLYVAATRAGDLLVVPKTPKASPYFDLIKAHLDRRVEALSELPPLRGEPRAFVRFDRVSEREARRAAAAREEWTRRREALIAEAKRAPAVLAPSRLGARAAPSRDPSAERVRPALPAAEPRSAAAVFGEAFHRLMELSALSLERPLGPLASGIAAELGIEGEAAELARLGERTLRSDLLARARSARRSYREAPFSLSLAGAFIEGRIDLVFEENGRWTVVDFKTDDAAPAGASDLAAYRAQAAVYAFALERLGMECAAVALCFARSDAVRMIECSPALLEEARRLIEESTESVPRG